LVNEKRIVENLYITKGQIFAEFVLEALIKKGVPRFVAYRDVQRVAFEAKDKGMQYIDAIKNDKAFSSKLTDKEIDSIFSPEKHLGASPAIISNVKKSVQSTIKKFI
jgi:adenylosuccinate lyase